MNTYGSTSPKQPIRVVLSDGHALFREAVGAALTAQPGIDVVAVTTTTSELTRRVETLRPDVVVLGEDGDPHSQMVEAIVGMKQYVPDVKILVLASAKDPDTLLDVLESGADGFLTKDCQVSELVYAVGVVNDGDVLVPGGALGPLLGQMMKRRQKREEALKRVWDLTPRERLVLRLLTEGGDNEAIGRALSISPHTARTHVQNALTKLGVHSRVEAAAFVVQSRMLEELEESSS